MLHGTTGCGRLSHVNTPKKEMTCLILVLAAFCLCSCGRQEAAVASSAPPAAPIPAKAEKKSPILAQSDLYRYGGSPAKVGYRGKLYNPNSVALTDVKVRWKVYEGEEYPNMRGASLYCEVKFALIPPLTTYDFESTKIRARTWDDGWPDTPRSSLKPEITFSLEPYFYFVKI